MLGTDDGTRLLDLHAGRVDRYAPADVALPQGLTSVEPQVGLTGSTISRYLDGAKHPSTTTVRLPAGLHGWYGDAWTGPAWSAPRSANRPQWRTGKPWWPFGSGGRRRSVR
ncbi:MAG TPA: hypothetical protein VGN37_10115 [Actinocatenispora sp.]